MSQPLLSGGEAIRNWAEVHEYHARLTFGSAALSTVRTRNIVSIIRNSAGNYTITLPRSYRHLVEVRSVFILSSGAILFPVVATNSVSVDGTLVLEYRTEAGVATDPADTTQAMLTVSASNSPYNDATI